MLTAFTLFIVKRAVSKMNHSLTFFSSQRPWVFEVLDVQIFVEGVVTLQNYSENWPRVLNSWGWGCWFEWSQWEPLRQIWFCSLLTWFQLIHLLINMAIVIVLRKPVFYQSLFQFKKQSTLKNARYLF